jgi:hypothetical protein
MGKVGRGGNRSRWWWAVGICCATALACTSSGPRNSDLKESLRDFDDRGDEHLDARRKAIEAQLDARPAVTVVRRAEVRVESVELTDTGAGGPSLELRLPIQNPWRLGAARSLHTAEVHGELASLERDGLEAEVLRCVQSVEYRSHMLLTQAWERHKQDITSLQSWLEALHDGQNISEPAYQRRKLSLRSQTLRTRPAAPPVAPAVLDPWALDSVVDAPPLDLDPAGLESLLLEHPLWEGYEAEEGRMGALSDEATARRLPWLQWISVNYDPGTDNRDARVEALLSFALPLGIDESSRARAYSARADALRWKAKALFEQHRLRLAGTLKALQIAEARGPELSQWMEDAAQQRTRAVGWVAARSVPLDQAQAVLEDAYGIERTVLETHRDAGLLRCETLALTGRRLDKWPRGNR